MRLASGIYNGNELLPTRGIFPVEYHGSTSTDAVFLFLLAAISHRYTKYRGFRSGGTLNRGRKLPYSGTTMRLLGRFATEPSSSHFQIVDGENPPLPSSPFKPDGLLNVVLSVGLLSERPGS